MKIIAHRGASGLALENTLASFELAKLLGVDAIELDIHKTVDNRLVVCHDADLSRVSTSDLKIASATLKQVQAVILNDHSSTVPTLEGALKMIGSIPAIIELKAPGCTTELLKIIKKFPRANISVASFKTTELAKLRRAGATTPLLALERTKPFDVIHLAKQRHFEGIGLNFWLLNPLTYLLIKRAGLSLYVYTINSHLIGSLIGWLYPSISICTNHPEWFIKHPWLKLRRSLRE